MKPQLYTVLKAYTSPYPDPILFHEGETVTVGQEFTEDADWKGWMRCEGMHNNIAWVPKQYLTIDGPKGRLKREYNAMELSVHVGEKLVVYACVNGFGMAENSLGIRGWVPMNHLEIMAYKCSDTM